MRRLDPLAKDWSKVLSFFNKNFGISDLDLESVLFLIGVNVLGKGPERFNKADKSDVIHLALCELLAQFGYYEKVLDKENYWPEYRMVKPLPSLSVPEQERFIKLAVIEYFKREGLVDSDD